MNKSSPIGIFDSGVGGTSIWQEIHKLLPNENIIYLADSKNAPYGNKSKQAIQELSIKNTEFLIKEGCKMIVIACNTATTNAISLLRSTYSIPFIGIEPAIKPAALKSKSKCIGILATRGTLSSKLFHAASEIFSEEVNIIEVIGEGLVPLIEKGHIESPELKILLEKHLTPIIEAKADYLVLGCSHYPYLVPQIKKLLPSGIKIIDSGEAVAKQTKARLKKHDLLSEETSTPKLQFFSNANTNTLSTLLASYKDRITVSRVDF